VSTPPPSVGPAPVRTDRPRDAALRILRLLASAPEPLTIVDLQARLGGHLNRFRAPLDHLVTEGFANEATVSAGGRGRPARAYTATAVGAQVALEEPDRALLGALIEGVAEVLAMTPDPVTTARTLGKAWGRRLPWLSLVEALAAQGFAPAVERERIVLRTCPMLDAARRDPEVVCAVHQGLIEAVSGEPLTLVPFAEPGGCVVRCPGEGDRGETSHDRPRRG
jgi:predicted ArsR family transcriptional regulator